MKGHDKWPEIGGKSLRNYPSAEFLRKNGIIEEGKAAMKKSKQIATLFCFLGFTILNEPPTPSSLLASSSPSLPAEGHQ